MGRRRILTIWLVALVAGALFLCPAVFLHFYLTRGSGDRIKQFYNAGDGYGHAITQDGRLLWIDFGNAKEVAVRPRQPDVLDRVASESRAPRDLLKGVPALPPGFTLDPQK